MPVILIGAGVGVAVGTGVGVGVAVAVAVGVGVGVAQLAFKVTQNAAHGPDVVSVAVALKLPTEVTTSVSRKALVFGAAGIACRGVQPGPAVYVPVFSLARNPTNSSPA